jgi:DNA invertase Pin-like site-specific DNA recombinase
LVRAGVLWDEEIMSKVTLKCAIYTRKSSEEGLEQGFNSLDAQREACEAFVLSQQHEGWKAIPTLYDDGGYSGGNIDRPALKQLLMDIDQKKVNVVVVYKVDRLTRSLADFAKIVELFDAKGISFVSVTQQFNTTSSMGRLTLNVLLSFAQFEREVTGERIRDKIAASKQKGMWMGGTVPIGYIGHERTLVIDEGNAKLIRYMYERYLTLSSIRALKMELDQAGIYSPQRNYTSGKEYGGVPFSRGNLQRILTNPIYIGKISHFDKVYEGQHPAIIDNALWEAVQNKRVDSKQAQEQRPKAPSDSLLTGILFDSEGLRLTPSHSQKQSKRFRYYLSQQLVNEGKASTPNGIRIPAQELETIVINQLGDWLNDSDAVINALNPEPEQMQNLIADSIKLAADLQENKTEQYQLLRQIIERVEVGSSHVSLFIKASALAIMNGVSSDKLITLRTNIQLKRCGYAMRLIITDENKHQTLKDQRLIDHISKAYQWLTLITSGKVQSIKEIADAEGLDQSHVTRTINKAFLAPDIIRAILNGTQPAHLTLKYLKQYRVLPNDWNEQKSLLGFNK